MIKQKQYADSSLKNGVLNKLQIAIAEKANTQKDQYRFDWSPFVLVGIVAMVLVMYLRLYFGVDTADEGFYLAMPYLFARGGQPFVHEWVAQQGAAVVFAPFVKIYISLVGSTDGLVLFGRHAYFLVSVFASWGIWRLCRQFLTPVVALFPALLPIVFHVGGIPNLSYNSQGALGWLLGLGFLYSCYFPFATGGIAAFAGASLLVIASFSYPSLSAIAALVLCLSYLFPPSPEGLKELDAVHKKHRIRIMLGSFLIAIPLLYVTFKDGFQPLLTSYEYASSTPGQGGGYDKIVRQVEKIGLSWRYGALVLSLLIFSAAPSFSKRWRRFSIIASSILLIPGFVALEQVWHERNIGDSGVFVIWLGLLSPVLYFFRPDRNDLKHLLVIWPLSLLAGLITAWTSREWVQGALGLMPAAVLSLYFVVRTWNVPVYAIRSVPVFLLLICIAAPQFLRVYQESPLIDLRTRIASGPYQGLFTGGWKSSVINKLKEGLALVSAGRSSLFIINSDNPGIYLMSALKPSGPTVWVSNQVPIQLQIRMFQDYFALPFHLPDVIMVMNGQGNEAHPLTSWLLEKGYEKQIDDHSYRIYVKTPT